MLKSILVKYKIYYNRHWSHDNSVKIPMNTELIIINKTGYCMFLKALAKELYTGELCVFSGMNKNILSFLNGVVTYTAKEKNRVLTKIQFNDIYINRKEKLVADGLLTTVRKVLYIEIYDQSSQTLIYIK